MSFAKPRPGGNKAYLDHIKEVGHGCYDAETDVLTLTGWKAWPDITEQDRLATLNHQTGLVEYHNPTGLIRYMYTGRMYRVDSQQVDLLVTPNHKMFVCPTTTKLGRKKQDYALIAATGLQHVSHAYMKGSDGSADGWWPACPGRDVFALLGFAIGDGAKGSKKKVRFHLSRERKISWLRSLCCRLAPLGFSLTEENSDRFIVQLPCAEHANGLIDHLFANIYDQNGEKQIPWSDSIFSGASRAGLEGLFEGLMQSDGHHGETSDSFDTTSPHLPGQFQQLCLHIGLASNIVYTYGPEIRQSSYGDKPLTRMSVIRRCLKPEVNKWSECNGRTSWVEDWCGEVFCAEVPNNILYVRRNGKTVWSGNSVIEHATWTLLLTGVSRSLTHELVRHRAGMAYSQLSQRYVDEGDCAFVVPPDLMEEYRVYLKMQEGEDNQGWSDEKSNAFAMWLNAITYAHKNYIDLTTYLSDKVDKALPLTDRRKFARQTARSVLPNATETKIVVTANARAIRHFLEQRGSRHAEPEIRRLANVILDLMQKEAPNLFSDYQLTKLNDGTHEINTPYRKV